MSERILRALMQLFAIIAKVDEIPDDKEDESIKVKSTKGRLIIEDFLKSELSSSDVKNYIEVFDHFLQETHGKLLSKRRNQKRTSVQSVKILRICDQVNKELTQRQKVIVLIRIFEFIGHDKQFTDNEFNFIQTVSESFHISDLEFNEILKFVIGDEEGYVDSPNHIYFTPNEKLNLKLAECSHLEGLDAPIHVLHVKSVKTLFFRYYGEDEMYINGQIVNSNRTHIFNIGSTVRTAKSAQIFYSDLISKLFKEINQTPLSFEVDHLSLSFNSDVTAISDIHFSTNTGNLIGLMGGSGTGKTTLLNLLNGKIKPTSGKVLINGIDLHKESKKLEGIIGYVDQNDVLNEELTVYQNLYFSAKMSMGGLNKTQLIRKTTELLKSLGLYEIRQLRVGTVLEKVISGGQRKRLNIALELIREPSILFIDEPTSGLSSKDSDNIIDLLKELTLKGKLIFAVIHQPSSNIFKLFDRLIILDKGGLPIYNGIPMQAIVHFKTFAFKGNSHERECSLCGNVNPEQIFNLIDEKIVDEFGNETQVRKKRPEDWNKIHRENRVHTPFIAESIQPKSSSSLPSKLIQYLTYLRRDFLSKIANTQYIFINLLIAPLLSVILSFFIKYYQQYETHLRYSFYDNENIPQYLFIIVIVAIFLGMTVSAEEIHRDKKILAREKFIHLSRASYLFSKASIMFGISALQSILFVLIGNWILEINGMFLDFWFIMFSVSCTSNLFGLIISSTFNSAKVIYIVIPLIIIPQLLFSGVIIKFDKLHPSLSNATKVPWVGNMMLSRWAYEALVVEQSTNNDFEKHFLQLNIDKTKAEWKNDYWGQELKRMLKSVNISDSTFDKELSPIILSELEREFAYWSNLKCEDCIIYNDEGSYRFDNSKIFPYLDKIRLQNIKTISKTSKKQDSLIDEIGIENYIDLREKNINHALQTLTSNKLEPNKFIIHNNRIYRNDYPIYNIPENMRFFESHFYAPYKYIFGKKVKTIQANLIVIWGMTIFSFLLLYFDVFRNLFDRIFKIKFRS